MARPIVVSDVKGMSVGNGPVGATPASSIPSVPALSENAGFTTQQLVAIPSTWTINELLKLLPRLLGPTSHYPVEFKQWELIKRYHPEWSRSMLALLLTDRSQDPTRVIPFDPPSSSNTRPATRETGTLGGVPWASLQFLAALQLRRLVTGSDPVFRQDRFSRGSDMKESDDDDDHRMRQTDLEWIQQWRTGATLASRVQWRSRLFEWVKHEVTQTTSTTNSKLVQVATETLACVARMDALLTSNPFPEWLPWVGTQLQFFHRTISQRGTQPGGPSSTSMPASQSAPITPVMLRAAATHEQTLLRAIVWMGDTLRGHQGWIQSMIELLILIAKRPSRTWGSQTPRLLLLGLEFLIPQFNQWRIQPSLRTMSRDLLLHLLSASKYDLDVQRAALDVCLELLRLTPTDSTPWLPPLLAMTQTNQAQWSAYFQSRSTGRGGGVVTSIETGTDDEEVLSRTEATRIILEQWMSVVDYAHYPSIVQHVPALHTWIRGLLSTLGIQSVDGSSTKRPPSSSSTSSTALSVSSGSSSSPLTPTTMSITFRLDGRWCKCISDLRPNSIRRKWTRGVRHYGPRSRFRYPVPPPLPRIA